MKGSPFGPGGNLRVRARRQCQTYTPKTANAMVTRVRSTISVGIGRPRRDSNDGGGRGGLLG
jgi:hypothetical protein